MGKIRPDPQVSVVQAFRLFRSSPVECNIGEMSVVRHPLEGGHQRTKQL